MTHAMTNPLLSPTRTPDFAAIKPEHFLPALDQVLADVKSELERIKADPAPASFANTVVPLDNLFGRARYIFAILGNLTLNTYSTELADIEEKASLTYAGVSKAVFQDAALGARFRAVYDNRAALNLDEDDTAILTHLHHAFEAQGGLLTSAADQALIRTLDENLISLANKFNANLQAAPLQNAVLITDKAELAGLSESEIDSLRDNAQKNGHADGWLFIPERLLVDEWLEKAESSAFRRKIFDALNAMGTVPPHDNRPIILEMQKNRDAYAKLLGYASYTAFSRSRAMVTDLARVEDLLDDVTAKALPKFEADMKSLEAFAAANGGPAKLEPWDVSYWVTRQRADLYHFDANAFTQYLEIENVVAGMFKQATDLFNVSFAEVSDQSTIHPDIRVYAVTDKTSKNIVGYLHVDMYARPGTKSGGAWMNNIQAQEDGRPVSVICNMNIAKPPAGEKALIGLSQYITLYHEMGHCLQGLLGMDVKHTSLQGTAGPADFVEIHSMINERRGLLKDNLKDYAHHYKTGVPAPDSVIDALLASQSFFETRDTLKLVQNSRRDLAFHAIDPAKGLSGEQIEKQVEINSPYAAHIRPYPLARFSHLFSDAHSGYAAGYVNYLLAHVHAAHGFVPFAGDAYNKDWSDKILSFYRRGSGGVPADLYRQFRGSDATPDAMLHELGIATDKTELAKAAPKTGTGPRKP